jgi:hypothetical protein
MPVEGVMKPLGMAGVSLLLVAGAASFVRADEVFLVGGGRIVGEVVERRADAVVVEVGPGRVTLPASRVARIATGTSALAVYRDRAARLSPHDTAGWLALGRWAQDNDLLTLAGEAFARVIAADPSNEAAHRALGHVRLAGQWMTEVESYRARGWVQYEGTWMAPEEAQAQAAQRALEAQARLAERESAAREREAEARARAAEADAARAAAEAEAAAATAGGIPYPWVFGQSYGPYGGYDDVRPPYLPGHRTGPPHGQRGRRDDGAGPSQQPQRDERARPAPPSRPSHPPAKGSSKGIPDSRVRPRPRG